MFSKKKKKIYQNRAQVVERKKRKKNLSRQVGKKKVLVQFSSAPDSIKTRRAFEKFLKKKVEQQFKLKKEKGNFNF